MSSNEEVNWTRSANVDQRRGQIIFASQSLTTDGFWEINDFIVSLIETASATELGETLLEALAACETDAEPLAPGQRSTPQTKRLLKIAGARSWNLGRRGGIDYLVDLEFRVDNIDAESVGRHLREALALAPIYNG
jgi:hypothetical protein